MCLCVSRCHSFAVSFVSFNCNAVTVTVDLSEINLTINTPKITLTVSDVATPTGGAPGGPWSPFATHLGPPGAFPGNPGLRNGGRAGAAVTGAVVGGTAGGTFVDDAAPNFWRLTATLFGVASSSRASSCLSFVVGENRFAFVGRNRPFLSLSVFSPTPRPNPPFTPPGSTTTKYNSERWLAAYSGF